MPEVEFPQLDRFEPGPARPMLPPAEVRRLGDRRRRRRTALTVASGALALLVAVGAPVLVMSGEDGRDVQPAPSPDGSEPTWITSVPAGFPLSEGFPEPVELSDKAIPNMTPSCGTFFTGQFADTVVASHDGEDEDRAQRELVLFSYETSAQAAMDQARASIDACPDEGISGPPGGGVTEVYDAVPVELGTEDSYAWSRQVLHGDGRVTDLTLVVVARTGNALYVESSHTAAAGDAVVAAETERLTEAAAAPLAQLCLFAADPC
jgi:hypothetical protein